MPLQIKETDSASSLMWLRRPQVPFSCPFVLLILTLLAVIWSQVAATFLGFVLRQWPQQKLVLLPWVTVSWPGKPLGVWWQTSCPVFFVRVSSGPSETSCGHARQSLTGVGKHLAVWERMECRAILRSGRKDGVKAGVGWKEARGLLEGSDSGTVHLLGFSPKCGRYFVTYGFAGTRVCIFMEFSGEIV